MLDIYGFEHFKTNSFEQFCINYANEKLQQEFNQHVFKLEQREYEAEEIDWTYIDFVDNEPCIMLIESKMGILSLLDEESRLRQGSDDGFTQKLYNSLGENQHFRKPRLGQSSFIVSHYAHDVEYDTAGFIEKNRDTVPDTVITLLSETTNSFLASVLSDESNDEDSEKNKEPQNSKLGSDTKARPTRIPKRPTLGNMFKDSLNELMTTISATNAHYIRCIKPNESKEPWVFDGPLVLNQLRACGVLETIRISSKGFPGRWLYEEFAERYKLLLHSSKRDQQPRDLSLTILEGFNDGKSEVTLFALGKQKVFLRAGMLAQLENRRTKRQVSAATEIQKYVKMVFARKRYIQILNFVQNLQTVCRATLARQHADRIRIALSITLAQTAARGMLARVAYAQTISSIKRVQEIAHAYIDRKHAEERSVLNTSLLVQSLVRKKLVQFDAAKTVRALAAVQSMIRRRTATKELEKLKSDKHTTELYEEQQHYEMENKVVELQNALALKREDQRATTEQIKQFEEENAMLKLEISDLKMLEESKTAETQQQILALEEALEQHRTTAQDLQEQLSTRIMEAEALQTQLSEQTELAEKLKEERENLVKENEALKLEIKNAPGSVPQIGDTAALNSYRHRIFADGDDDDKEQRFNELAVQFAYEYEHNEESVMANSTLEDILRENDDLRNELISGLIKNLVIPTATTGSAPIPKGDVLFPSNIFNVVISEMWRFGLLQQSEKLINLFLRSVQEKVLKYSLDELMISAPFWLTNLHQIYSFITLVEHNLDSQLNDNMSKEEVDQYVSLTNLARIDVHSAIFNVYFVYMREIKKHIDKIIVASVVEEQSIPGFKTESTKKLMNLFSRDTNKEDAGMDRLIMFLNKIYTPLDSYYLEQAYIHMPLYEVMSLIAVRSFNDMIMRTGFLSWKRGVQINYNVTRLDEWCKGHNFPKGGLPLEPLTQASKLLQLRKNYEADVSVIYDICWNLNPTQIQRIISNYKTEDYEAPIHPGVHEYVTKRVREDRSSGSELLFPNRLISDAGPFEVPPPRSLEKLEPYLPPNLDLPKVRGFLELTTKCFALAEDAKKLAEERARLEVYGSEVPMNIADLSLKNSVEENPSGEVEVEIDTLEETDDVNTPSTADSAVDAPAEQNNKPMVNS